MSSPLCLRHRADPVAAICQRCGEALCDRCWNFLSNDKPLCALCVHEMEWRAQRRWSGLAVFILVSAGLCFWLSRHVSFELSAGAWIAVTIAALLGVIVTRSGASNAEQLAKRIVRRTSGTTVAGDALERSAHPYRTRLMRAVVVPDATLSASTTAFVVGFLLVATGILVPVALKLPRWIEFEIVLAAWWAMLFGFLAVLLHRGTRVREDHDFRVRWNLGSLGENKKPSGKSSRGGEWLDFADPGCVDVEGCAGLLVGVLLAALAVVAAWLVVELVFPTVFFLLYWLVVKAVARVANDRHGCEHDFGRAVSWGALWATVYTLPIGVVVWIVHLILAARAHG